MGHVTIYDDYVFVTNFMMWQPSRIHIVMEIVQEVVMERLVAAVWTIDVEWAQRYVLGSCIGKLSMQY